MYNWISQNQMAIADGVSSEGLSVIVGVHSYVEPLWDIHVKDVQSALNTAYSKSINCTSTEVLMGYKAKPMTETKLLTVVQNDLDRFDLKQLRVNVKERITADQAKQKEYYDRPGREANE
ncbi:hypothetical protein ILUMI_09381 [Ignelater luminosus]|uniref:Uncharacterized protein n=1 Tax=Ignelater luminosus TaxID=2038154 RepID=A0A8K0D2I7_IGNLU|nr:hypothetical protein ILUMI_09381 [Ignelater luminosus]